KWTPLRPLRLADQMHASLGGSAIGFLGITLDAGADNVFPCRRPTTVARDDVIEIQVFAVEFYAAILASVLVALENVVAREFDLFLGQAVEERQQNHSRHANAE